ncbi:MAG TPA: MucR family transcriptional regulator [Mesorhizobium sp.]|nr:MucR family transcriptional regulator [Mesorhizobium sp.]
MSDQTDTQAREATDHRDLTVAIVSAYVANNSLEAAELPALIAGVASALAALANPAVEPAAPAPTPAVNPKRSVFADYIVSLEDGKRYKTLKRHLSTKGLTPQQYREKWSLPADYPMVAPTYGERRSELAKSLGLGRKRNPGADEQEPTPSDQAMAAE